MRLGERDVQSCTEGGVTHCTTVGDAPCIWTMTVRMSLGVSLVDALISLCPRPGVGRYLDLKVPFPPYASFPLFVKSGI